MDKVNKQELRRLAETSVQRRMHNDASEEGEYEFVQCVSAHSYERLSAAILSLLDELERLEANHNQLNHGVAVAATSEWNRLAEENDQLRAELEQYRKDAERYRWLYDQPGFHLWLDEVCRDEQISSVGPDTDIDALMAKEGGANG